MTPNDPTQESVSAHSFHCSNCGAKLQFQPGTEEQVCPYCDAHQEIAESTDAVIEHDFRAALADLQNHSDQNEELMIKCQACAAEFSTEPNVTSQECPFCGTNIVSTAHSVKQIKPQALLPFKVTRQQGRDLFKNWILKLWFAPNKLKNNTTWMTA